MNFAIFEPDELAAGILTFIARRRGHKAIWLPGADRLSERLPFEPSASIVALDELRAESIEQVRPLREQYPDVPILLTVQRIDNSIPLIALDAGVSDVIRKPYHPHQLIARAELHALSRGGMLEAQSDVLRLADLEVDLGRYMGLKNGVDLPLTRLELRLLYCLAEHHPYVAPSERLLSFGWDAAELPDGRLLKTHISHIRKKLRSAGGVPFDVGSRHSLGYTLSFSEPAARSAS